MKNYLDKIKKRINKLEGGKRRIANKIGVSDTTILRIFRGQEIKLTTLLDVCIGLEFSKKEILEVYEEWSLERVGKFLEIGENIKDFSELEKSILKLKQFEKTNKDGELDSKIPIYDHIYNKLGNSEPVNWISMNNQKDLRGIISHDVSMQPTILDKSIIFFNEAQELKDGDIGVFLLDDKEIVKRLFIKKDFYILQSDNKKYPPILIDKNDNFKICGRVTKILNNI